MADRLVIFGGTFDPVHFGHLIVARAVAERLQAKSVMLMPTNAPPHKPAPVAVPLHRLAMLKLAVADDELFEVATLELDRPGSSYTYDTLVELRRAYGSKTELLWVIGLDMLVDLPHWHKAREVLEMARIVTAGRPPLPADPAAALAGLRQWFSPDQVDHLIGDILATPLVEISASDIRRRLGAGQAIRYLTPQVVIDYIDAHHLYRRPQMP